MKFTQLIREAQVNLMKAIKDHLWAYAQGDLTLDKTVTAICDDIGCDSAAKKRVKKAIEDSAFNKYKTDSRIDQFGNAAEAVLWASMKEPKDWSDVDHRPEEYDEKKGKNLYETKNTVLVRRALGNKVPPELEQYANLPINLDTYEASPDGKDLTLTAEIGNHLLIVDKVDRQDIAELVGDVGFGYRTVTMGDRDERVPGAEQEMIVDGEPLDEWYPNVDQFLHLIKIHPEIVRIEENAV